MGSDDNAKTSEYKLPSLIIRIVSSNQYIEKYCKYKKIPQRVAIKDTRIPIKISFFINPMNLFFESCDELLNQIEQVQ